jgi:hypothetical protein
MALQPPPSPSITPQQMNLLRIVASMAWSDGNLADEEVDVMLDRFSSIFAAGGSQHQELRQELRDYLMQNIPLSELTPKLQSREERELVLRLGYEVICSSARSPQEEKINDEEAIAYQNLVQLLDLPSEVVQQIEAEIAASDNSEGIVDRLTHELEDFIQK